MDGDQGRLEVCVNSAWGTVCSDAFGASDAAVACEAIGGYNSTGKYYNNESTEVCNPRCDAILIKQTYSH